MSNVEALRRSAPATLVGRDGELELLGSFLGEAAVHGGALLLSGDPGVGKTALLDAAAEQAAAAGTQVVRAAGVEFEADVSFSGLNQALLPLQAEFEQLGAVQREALSVALGFGGGRPPADRLIVSNAALALLREAAAARPLLLVVDDLPWLDRPSAAVLGFVARRLADSRVGFVAALRSDSEGFFDRGGLPELELQPLDDDHAKALVGERFPALAATVRRHVLAQAQGNPLALLELPAALSGAQRISLGPFPGALPHSRRLQALFAARVPTSPARPCSCCSRARWKARATSASWPWTGVKRSRRWCPPNGRGWCTSTSTAAA